MRSLIPSLVTLLFLLDHYGAVAQCTKGFILDHMQEQVPYLDPANVKLGPEYPLVPTYVIPTVVHIFHDGDQARIDMEQVHSAIQVLNDDFNGRNEGWSNIDPLFDDRKAIINIQFCLATIDVEGHPTTGIVYYDDPAAMRREKNLYQFAWPNDQYFNIYLPEYVFDPNTNFTAFATLPNASTIAANRDGVHYSSVRFGYGGLSQLEEGDEWVSVITHEVGHWLGLLHTFQGGCSASNDGIADTPPTMGSEIYLSGCRNNDESCGVPTNGSNYMDYNHRCKRMFTQGQVRVMLSILNGLRASLWSDENLQRTGCAVEVSTEQVTDHPVLVYPNPSDGTVHLSKASTVHVYDVSGRLVKSDIDASTIHLSQPGLYILEIDSGQQRIIERVLIY